MEASCPFTSSWLTGARTQNSGNSALPPTLFHLETLKSFVYVFRLAHRYIHLFLNTSHKRSRQILFAQASQSIISSDVGNNVSGHPTLNFRGGPGPKVLPHFRHSGCAPRKKYFSVPWPGVCMSFLCDIVNQPELVMSNVFFPGVSV